MDTDKLAQHIVELMDMDDLMNYAIDKMADRLDTFTDDELKEKAEQVGYKE